mmetsp:Transcript_17509/g.43399  ORF Transcript_17509/g.43399 Transcript_17509/m.43399 type:complete len:216 (-) Transcript_17509:1462-2109(-)
MSYARKKTREPGTEATAPTDTTAPGRTSSLLAETVSDWGRVRVKPRVTRNNTCAATMLTAARPLPSHGEKTSSVASGDISSVICTTAKLCDTPEDINEEVVVMPDATTPAAPARTAQVKVPAGGAKVDVTSKLAFAPPVNEAAAGGSATEMYAPDTTDGATLPYQLTLGINEAEEEGDTRLTPIAAAASGTAVATELALLSFRTVTSVMQQDSRR